MRYWLRKRSPLNSLWSSGILSFASAIIKLICVKVKSQQYHARHFLRRSTKLNPLRVWWGYNTCECKSYTYISQIHTLHPLFLELSDSYYCMNALFICMKKCMIVLRTSHNISFYKFIEAEVCLFVVNILTRNWLKFMAFYLSLAVIMWWCQITIVFFIISANYAIIYIKFNRLWDIVNIHQLMFPCLLI